MQSKHSWCHRRKQQALPHPLQSVSLLISYDYNLINWCWHTVNCYKTKNQWWCFCRYNGNESIKSIMLKKKTWIWSLYDSCVLLWCHSFVKLLTCKWLLLHSLRVHLSLTEKIMPLNNNFRIYNYIFFGRHLDTGHWTSNN